MLFQYARSKKEAMSFISDVVRENWKYYGIAYDKKMKTYLAFWTDTKTHYAKLLKGGYDTSGWHTVIIKDMTPAKMKLMKVT
jgi:hypothetical protein